MAKKTLILGGVRSGKSVYAEQIVLNSGKKPVHIATSQIFDEEMQMRVDLHQKRRNSQWKNKEEPIDLVGVIKQYDKADHIILVDCLSVWLSNLLHFKQETEFFVDELIKTIPYIKADLVLVSSEVGLGILPENALARKFCDDLGRLNQSVAAILDEVYFITAGSPLKLKG